MEGSLSRISTARPGGHELSREVVARHQRERILSAVVELVAEEGYRAVSVAKIVKRARTTRGTFYEKFSSKEGCFLAAFDDVYEDGMQRVVRAVEDAGESGGSFAGRVEAGVEAMVGYLAQHPERARACFLEAPALGAAIAERGERARGACAELLRHARAGEAGAGQPDSLDDSVLGGLYWLVYQALLDGRPQALDGLGRQLTDFALAAYLGPEAARSRTR